LQCGAGGRRGGRESVRGGERADGGREEPRRPPSPALLRRLALSACAHSSLVRPVEQGRSESWPREAGRRLRAPCLTLSVARLISAPDPASRRPPASPFEKALWRGRARRAYRGQGLRMKRPRTPARIAATGASRGCQSPPRSAARPHLDRPTWPGLVWRSLEGLAVHTRGAVRSR